MMIGQKRILINCAQETERRQSTVAAPKQENNKILIGRIYWSLAWIEVRTGLCGE